ncbi:DUF6249 domain-containing protein [Flavimarina sp. Hel_I_48]|uniref:DUF6249 domain-containing protein n=1 Tax=Flavimarina sp. Hel_I_48 TaxID=1392488 RepID=UPI0004DF0548|nr:DUF6249 domain-containing protein [Flavimarina sp. Hel_I_48]
MGAELVFISAFLVIFGVFYLYYSTRNKERLALIEKGADANIFVRSKGNGQSAPVWKILLLNLGLLLLGVGLGIILGFSLRYAFEFNEGAAVTASVFVMSGISLIVGFFLTRRLIK